MTVEQFKSRFDALSPSMIGSLTLQPLEGNYQCGNCCGGELGIVFAGYNIQNVIMIGFTDSAKLLFAIAVLLDVGDVKNKKEHQFIQSKTGKTISIAFNNELQSALREYCMNRDPNEALILSSWNEYKPLGRNRAWAVLRKVGNKYGIHMGTHTMRKTCAYHYYMQTKFFIRNYTFV